MSLSDMAARLPQPSDEITYSYVTIDEYKAQAAAAAAAAGGESVPTSPVHAQAAAAGAGASGLEPGSIQDRVVHNMLMRR